MQKHPSFLNLLSKTHPIQQRDLSEISEPDQVCAICEFIYNIMHGNMPIPRGIKQKLIFQKQVLHDFADAKVSYKRKKTLLLQSGGSILGALLSPAISAILGFCNISEKYSYLMVLITRKAYFTHLRIWFQKRCLT